MFENETCLFQSGWFFGWFFDEPKKGKQVAFRIVDFLLTHVNPQLVLVGDVVFCFCRLLSLFLSLLCSVPVVVCFCFSTVLFRRLCRKVQRFHKLWPKYLSLALLFSSYYHSSIRLIILKAHLAFKFWRWQQQLIGEGNILEWLLKGLSTLRYFTCTWGWRLIDTTLSELCFSNSNHHHNCNN